MAKSISERRAKLEADLARVKAQEDKQINGKFIVIGKAIMDAMDNDDELKSKLQPVLDQHVTRNPDRELIGLEKRASNRGRPRKTED